MSPAQVASAAAGGAVGAALRFVCVSLAGRWLGHGFPYGTLLVNLLGSVLMGALIELVALRLSLCEAARVFVVVGVLGGFTTFSTFSLDVVSLAARAPGLAALYAGGSVALGVVGVLAAMGALRWMLS